MSNSQWPPPPVQQPGPPPGQSPWSQPDPRWTPQSYHDTSGRDPRRPFGSPSGGTQPPYGQPQGSPPQQPSIDSFQAPRSSLGKPILIGVAIVGAIAILLVALQFFGPGTTASPSPTPAVTQSAGATSMPTAAETSGTKIPFEGNGTGTFEVLSQSWSGDSLVVKLRVTLDEGQSTKSFSTYVFNNQSMQVSDPTDTTPFSVTAGQPYEGTFTFNVPKGKTTAVLASGSGRALTALPING